MHANCWNGRSSSSGKGFFDLFGVAGFSTWIMMKYASCFTANSGVRTVPIASETGISTSERLYFCTLGPCAKEFGASKNTPRIPAVLAIGKCLDIQFIRDLNRQVAHA